MGTSPVWFNDTALCAACGRRRFPHGLAGEVLEGIGCEPFVFQGFGCCDQVGVNFGFHGVQKFRMITPFSHTRTQSVRFMSHSIGCSSLESTPSKYP